MLLRRFFLGGAPELEDVRFAAIPPDQAGQKVVSKLGLRTESSGTITCRMNVVHVHKAPSKAGPTPNLELHHSTRRFVASEASVHSANAVLAAFQRAKKRMSRVQKSAGPSVTTKV